MSKSLGLKLGTVTLSSYNKQCITLKKNLAKKYTDNRLHHTEQKDVIIKGVIRIALAS